MSTLTLVLDGVPPPELLPNRSAHRHWRYRHAAAKTLRESAGWDAQQQFPVGWETITGPVAVRLHVAWPA